MQIPPGLTLQPDTVCPDCHRQPFYADLHQTYCPSCDEPGLVSPDGTVAAVLLQDHTAAAPGDFS